jgi:exodeoxyribonuclease VII small subunit
MSDKSIRYNEAVKEIEEILRQIENEELDVDDLSTKVKRAYFLLNLCKEKLHSTEKDIEKIMNDFKGEGSALRQENNKEGG